MSDTLSESKSSDKTPAPTPTCQSANPTESRGENLLLVVEDEPDDFVLLRRALRKAGALVSIRWAQSAPEALAVLEEVDSAESRVCVIADVKLPGTDGFDLLNRVKSRACPGRVKFAFLTGRRDRSTEERARACGADAFFEKPARSDQLTEIAEALLRLAAQCAVAIAAIVASLAIAV